MGVLGKSLTDWRFWLFLSQPRSDYFMLQWGHRRRNTWEALGAHKRAHTSGVVSIAWQSDQLGSSNLELV